LADGVEVSGASLEKGLLNVFLLRKNIEPKVKKIKIDSNE
jgi:HSP20 family molecular chaperone IbpA